MTSRLRKLAGHAAYPFWVRRKRSRVARAIYEALETFATRNDDRRRDLLRWSYRETEIGWGNRQQAAEDQSPDDSSDADSSLGR